MTIASYCHIWHLVDCIRSEEKWMAFRYFPAVLLSLSCCTEGPVFLGIVRVNLSRPSLFLPAFLIDSAQSAPLLAFLFSYYFSSYSCTGSD